MRPQTAASSSRPTPAEPGVRQIWDYLANLLLRLRYPGTSCLPDFRTRGNLGYGVYASTDYGQHWIARNNGLTNTTVNALAASGSNVFVGDTGGLFRSTDDGNDWQNVEYIGQSQVSSLAILGNHVFAATYPEGSTPGEVYHSSDSGASWTVASLGLPNGQINCLAANGQYVFAGLTQYLLNDTYEGLFRLSYYGMSWTECDSGAAYPAVISLLAYGSNVFFGTWGFGLYASTNDGNSWSPENSGLTGDSATWINCILVSGGYLLVGT